MKLCSRIISFDAAFVNIKPCVCVRLHRSCRTSWKPRASSPGSCRACWAPTCALFTPQTGGAHINIEHTCAVYVLGVCRAVIKLRFPWSSLSPGDISHIQGNLEEISTFQQLLVQSLEEHTKSVQHPDTFAYNP